MTPDGAFDRRLTSWLEEDAAPRAPHGFNDVVTESVNRKRQLPSWSTPERWISMETRAQLGAMPLVLIALLTIALLTIGAVGGYAIGSGLVDGADVDGADDAGPLDGFTYSTPEGAIYQYPADETGGPIRLTGDDEYATIPVWSPDRTRFAYQAMSGPTGPMTLMVRDADGSNPVAVSEPYAGTPRGLKPEGHAWSPDSSMLVFAVKDVYELDGKAKCGLSVCDVRIWTVPADGSESAQVVGDPSLHSRAPVFAPDGESIIFAGSTGAENGYGIYRMDVDGTNVERIGDLTGFTHFSFDGLSISPDGTKLATHSTTDANGQVTDIYVLDLVTGEDVRIDVASADDFGPNWSPDSSRIVFTSWAGEPRPVLYDVDSGEVTPVDMVLEATGWSPDGRSILGNCDQVMSVVDVTDPTAPLVTDVAVLPEAGPGGWYSCP